MPLGPSALWTPAMLEMANGCWLSNDPFTLFFPKFYNKLYIYIIYNYIYTNLPVNDIVRLPHPQSGDSQGQEMFLAPSADKQIRNYRLYDYIYIYIYII